MIAVVIDLVRIQAGGDGGRVEIIDDEVGELTRELVGPARLLHVEVEYYAIHLRRIDLAAVDVLHRHAGIGEVAAAWFFRARVDGDGNGRHRNRGRRDAGKLIES